MRSQEKEDFQEINSKWLKLVVAEDLGLWAGSMDAAEERNDIEKIQAFASVIEQLPETDPHLMVALDCIRPLYEAERDLSSYFVDALAETQSIVYSCKPDVVRAHRFFDRLKDEVEKAINLNHLSGTYFKGIRVLEKVTNPDSDHKETFEPGLYPLFAGFASNYLGEPPSDWLFVFVADRDEGNLKSFHELSAATLNKWRAEGKIAFAE